MAVRSVPGALEKLHCTKRGRERGEGSEPKYIRKCEDEEAPAVSSDFYRLDLVHLGSHHLNAVEDFLLVTG